MNFLKRALRGFPLQKIQQLAMQTLESSAALEAFNQKLRLALQFINSSDRAPIGTAKSIPFHRFMTGTQVLTFLNQ